MLSKVPGWLLKENDPLTIRWSYLPKLLPWLIGFTRADGDAEHQRRASAVLAALHVPLRIGTRLQPNDASRYLPAVPRRSRGIEEFRHHFGSEQCQGLHDLLVRIATGAYPAVDVVNPHILEFLQLLADVVR